MVPVSKFILFSTCVLSSFILTKWLHYNRVLTYRKPMRLGFLFEINRMFHKRQQAYGFICEFVKFVALSFFISLKKFCQCCNYQRFTMQKTLDTKFSIQEEAEKFCFTTANKLDEAVQDRSNFDKREVIIEKVNFEVDGQNETEINGSKIIKRCLPKSIPIVPCSVNDYEEQHEESFSPDEQNNYSSNLKVSEDTLSGIPTEFESLTCDQTESMPYEPEKYSDKITAAKMTVKLLAIGTAQAMTNNMARQPLSKTTKNQASITENQFYAKKKLFSLPSTNVDLSTVATTVEGHTKKSVYPNETKDTNCDTFEETCLDQTNKRISISDAVQFLVSQSETKELNVPKLQDVFELFIKEKNFYMAEKAFLLLQNSEQLSVNLYKKIIRLCCRYNKYAQAEQHLTNLIKRLTISNPDPSHEFISNNILSLCFIIYMDSLVSAGLWENLFKFFQSVLHYFGATIPICILNKVCCEIFKYNPDRSIVSMILFSITEAHRVSTLQGTRVLMDENLLLTCLQAALRNHDKDECLKLYYIYTSEWSNKFVPDLQTCGHIIKFLGRYHNIKECCAFFKFIKQKYNNRLNEITYGCMLDAYVSKHMITEAEDLLKQMKAEGFVAPNTIIYSTIIKGYAQTKQLGEALELYKKIKQEKIPLNTVTYNTLIDACARAHAMDQAAKVLDEMLDSNVQPDIITFSTIVKGYCIQNDVNKAVQLLNIMTERGISPDGVLFNILLDGCVRASKMDLCEQLWQRMQNQGLVPSNITLTILIKMFGREGNLTQAFELVGEIPKKTNIRINTHVYTCLMSACITNKNYSKALEVFHCMKKDGVEADLKTYETILFGLMKWGNFAEAIWIVREIFQLDQPVKTEVSFKMYSKCLRALWNVMQQAGQMEMVANTIEDMKAAYGNKIKICLPKNNYVSKKPYNRKDFRRSNENYGTFSTTPSYSSLNTNVQHKWKNFRQEIH